MAKGPYVGPKTQPGSIIPNGPLDLLCVDFTTMDLSRDSEENVTGYQPYELMFGHKAPTVCNAWPGLAQ